MTNRWEWNMEQGVEVGKKLPINLPEGEGLFVDIGQEGLLLFVRIDNVERVKGYGWHASKEFPYGLMSWSFKFSLEGIQKGQLITPFNVHGQECHIVSNFLLLPKEKTMLTQVLINKEGIVYGHFGCYLDTEFVQTLQAAWSDTSLDWSKYDSELERVRKDRSIAARENTKIYYLEDELCQKP